MAEKCVMEKVEGILECSLCLGILVDPRTLNCLHSYCLGCIADVEPPTTGKQDDLKSRPQAAGATNDPPREDGYECPLCRRFTLKAEVRKNHLIVQLLDAYHTA